MKIAILGAGATGSVFGAFLKKGGAEDVWLIDLNKEHMEKVAKEGLIMRSAESEERITGLHTTTKAADVGICDVLIIVVKATQTDAALSGAMCCIGPNTTVVSLQNGIGNELAIEKFVPPTQIAYGCGRIATALLGPGVCMGRPAAGITNLVLGAYKKSEQTEAACKALCELFSAGGLNPVFYDDVRPITWKKAASNSGFNTMGAILGLTIKQMYENEDAFTLVKRVFFEAGEVAKALGISDDLYDSLMKDVTSTVKSYGDSYPSMAQDVLMYDRQTEVMSLTGAISNYGDRVGIETPTCDVLSHIIKAIQANYDVRYRVK